MLIFGFKASEIKNIKVEGVKELLKMIDRYDDCVEDCSDENGNPRDPYILEWLKNYETETYYGIGALIYDAIIETEQCDVTIEEADGDVYVGIPADFPWYFSAATKGMTEKEYIGMLRTYITKVTDDKVSITTYHKQDDAGY